MRKLILLVLLAAVPVSQAGIVFSDNFNTENGGAGVLNYAGFANWAVSDGTVDLIGNGYFDFQPGYGLYVDMDGSTGNAGKMTTSMTLAPGVYELSFDLAGNHRNGAAEQVTVQVSLGSLLNETFSLSQNDPFTTFTRTFVVNAAQNVSLSFEGAGGDNIGMLLDNVQLATVPAPAAVLLGVLGAGTLAALRRRLA